jgi:hypothetical protein
MQQDEQYDGQHDKNRRRRGRNTEAHIERAGKRKAREEQHGARKKAKRTNGTNSLLIPPSGPPAGPPPPAAAVRGGQCVAAKAESVQGGQHSDVRTARLPVSTQTLRSCLIDGGQLNKELIPLRHPPRALPALGRNRLHAPSLASPGFWLLAASPEFSSSCPFMYFLLVNTDARCIPARS